MSIIINEHPSSRRVRKGGSPGANLIYWGKGTSDVYDMIAAFEGVIPGTFDPYDTGLTFWPRTDLDVVPMFDDLWIGTADYAPGDSLGSVEYEFDTMGGATAHITQSIATVNSYNATGQSIGPANFNGLIGVTAERQVEGTDVPLPAYFFSEVHSVDPLTVTDAFKANLFQLTKKVNTAVFKGFQPGECLFLGAQGTKRNREWWTIRYQFCAQPNLTNVTIGPFTGITKKGWDHLWVYVGNYNDPQARDTIIKPRWAYVEQILFKADLNLLGI